MMFYDIHAHKRRNEGVSFLNVYPEEYSKQTEGYVSCGVHPWNVEHDMQFGLLESVVQQANVIAIGETGYDALRGASLDVQEKSFEKHIELSEHYEKPMIVHCVKAWDWLIASQKKYNPKQVWIIHGFRGKPELAQQLLNRGMMLSIGENFNEETVRLIPADNLFCETDNSESTIAEIYKLIAKARNVEVLELQRGVEDNVKRIFKCHNVIKC